MQLERQQQDIRQTFAHIKALEEKMDKKEVSSNVLHCACSCQVWMSILLSDFPETQNEQLVIGG
jgi:hypothetical protein